ncbi:ATP-binding protein [Nocardia uniformis]|uniref:ATP-binding protein n=2 Tax=Nocardia uniformis TaxID=53432 RepID=A0A849BTU5_9NOCA|nr:ATP-binding protein [Nocardia uniformis]
MSSAQRSGLIARKAQAMVAEALDDTRVVTINGARQSGKSTLAQLVASTRDPVRSLTLDDHVALRAAEEDPVGFIEHDGLLIIDEVQRATGLFLSIKADVDADPRPGRFLLTGSAQVLALKSLPDALPGRMETIELWPFSQGEIADTPDRFIDAAFTHGHQLTHDSDLRRRDYLDRAAIGGFPEAVRRTDRRRAAFFESYLDTLIKRDVQEISAIERTPQLRKLLQLLAVRSANLLVPATLSGELDLHRSSVTRYLALLETVFLIKTIPAWSGGATYRAIGTPKLAFVDTGLLCHLLGQGPARLADPGGAAGTVLENFVLMELARQLTWSDERATLWHYRTKDKVEVDAVLEAADGRVIGIEVKSAATLHKPDFAGLRHLQERLGDRFVAGYILYSGQHSLSFGDRLRALPIETLWRAAP